MDPVPPPHERSWRHPSELAPPPLEETPRRVRIVAAVTGAASVALVGLFALTVTPSNSAVVVSSSTLTPSATMVGASATATGLDQPVTNSPTDHTPFESEPETADEKVVVFVDGNATITTSAETDPRGLPIATVRFSSRLSTRGVLINVVGDIAVIELDPDRPQDRELVEKLELPEYVVASSVPDEATEVRALSSSPQDVRLDDLDDLHLEPGTPVVDENNHLIAICNEEGDVEVVAPEPPPVTSTTEDPGTTDPPSTTDVPPPTTLPDTTSTTTPDTGTIDPSTSEVPDSSSTLPDTTRPTTTDNDTSTSSTSSTTTTTTEETSPPSDGSTTESDGSPTESDGSTTESDADATSSSRD